MCVCVCVHVRMFSCVRHFVTPRTVACQAPLSVGLFWQDYWSGLSFPSLGDLPDPGNECRSPLSSELAGENSLLLSICEALLLINTVMNFNCSPRLESWIIEQAKLCLSLDQYSIGLEFHKRNWTQLALQKPGLPKTEFP